MAFNRPDPSHLLQDRVHKIAEGLSEEDPSIYWNDADAVLICDQYTILVIDQGSYVEALVNHYDNNGWQDYDDSPED